MGGCVLEVPELAEESSRGDNAEADPDPVDSSAQNRNDLVSEELQWAEADITVSAYAAQRVGRYLREGTTGRT